MLHGRMLTYLDEVARSGSIRRAAARLNVASSAINRQILDLEAELGVPLFERLPRKLRPTTAGEVIIAHARRTLSDYRAIEGRLGEFKGLHGGAVKLATMNGLAGGIAPRVIAAFTARYPRIKVTMRVMFVPDILRALADGEADLGLGYHLPDVPGLTAALRLDAGLVAVVGADHPLAARGKIRLQECEGFPLILADPSLRMHHTVLEAFARANLPADAAFLSNSIDFLKSFVQHRQGIAFLSPFDIIEEQRAGRVIALPIQEPVVLSNPLSLVHRATEALDPAAAALADHLRAALLAPMAQE